MLVEQQADPGLGGDTSFVYSCYPFSEQGIRYCWWYPLWSHDLTSMFCFVGSSTPVHQELFLDSVPIPHHCIPLSYSFPTYLGQRFDNVRFGWCRIRCLSDSIGKWYSNDSAVILSTKSQWPNSTSSINKLLFDDSAKAGILQLKRVKVPIDIHWSGLRLFYRFKW